MKFALIASLITVTSAGKTFHEKLLEEIAKQEAKHPSGNGFKAPKEEKEEDKL